MGLKKEMRLTHRPMTAAELRALAANPLFDIGGHTVTHPNLSTLAAAEQEQEIVFGLPLPRRDAGEADSLLFVSIWPKGASDPADRCGSRI